MVPRFLSVVDAFLARMQKVDRSGAYIARQFAVQYLKATNAKEVIVKVAYAIGIAEPVMITVAVDHGNGIVSERLHDSLTIPSQRYQKETDLKVPSLKRLRSGVTGKRL